MANHLGREGLVKISTTLIGELRNYALSHSSDVVEDSVIGDTYRTRLATMKTWSASGDLYWDETDAGQLLITIGSSVTLNLYPEGADTGDRYYSSAAIVTKFDISASFDGLVEGSIAFEGNGSLSVLTAS
jgi:predicted secreted protein